MTHRSDRPVILGHGGSRRSSETYLKNAPIPDQSAAVIPHTLISLAADPAVSAPQVSAPAPTPLPVAAPTPAAINPTTAPQGQTIDLAGGGPPPPVTPAPAVLEVKTKKDLFMLTKDQAITFARAKGLAVSDADTAKAIKEKIATALGFIGPVEG